MGKIVIKMTGIRPSIKFCGTVTNNDIEKSLMLLDFYLPKRNKNFNPITKFDSIDIPLGDCNGEE